MKILPEHLNAKYDYTVDLTDTVSYTEQWYKYKGKVYRVLKIEGEEFVNEMPFMDDVPYTKLKEVINQQEK